MHRRSHLRANARPSPRPTDHPAPLGLGQRQMRALNRIALGILVIGVLGCAGMLGTIPFLGYAPENPYADASTSFLIPGLILPLALTMLTSALPATWFSPQGEWQAPGSPRDAAVKLAATTAVGALALAMVMGSATPLLFIPAVQDAVPESVGYLAIGLVLFSLVLSAIVGAIVMGGWRAGAIGLVFGAGFIALVFGLVNADAVLARLGITALGISGAGFYLLGVITQRLPILQLQSYNQPLAAAASAIVAGVGLYTNQWVLMLSGVLGVAAFIGIRIALRMQRR